MKNFNLFLQTERIKNKSLIYELNMHNYIYKFIALYKLKTYITFWILNSNTHLFLIKKLQLVFADRNFLKFQSVQYSKGLKII